MEILEGVLGKLLGEIPVAFSRAMPGSILWGIPGTILREILGGKSGTIFAAVPGETTVKA